MLGFTYFVDFWDFSNEVLTRRTMTEQKTRVARPRPSHILNQVGVTWQHCRLV